MRIGITGASGSLGTALIQRLIQSGIGPIVAITRDEWKADQMVQRYGGEVRVMVVADGLANRERLIEVFRGCDVIVHAGAMKRISESVYSTQTMIDTNIIGTINVLKAATDARIGKVLMISTDKGVASQNLYGGTKFVAECATVQHNAFAWPRGVRMSVLRYGNVIGSRGSVIPLWQEQAAHGQALMLTHRDMSRFLLTLSRAVDYILASIMVMKGGEIFVPLLPSAKMYDVAMAIVGDPERITVMNQLRPGGEKLAEQLLSEEEPRRTVRRKLYGSHGEPLDVYTVLPAHRTWTSEGYSGDPVPEDLVYRSDTNTWQLSIEEIRGLFALA